jgi:hypothetical protein
VEEDDLDYKNYVSDEYYDDEDEKSGDEAYTVNTDKEPVYKTEP